MTAATSLPYIFIIEDEPIMAECLARAAQAELNCEIRIFSNAVFAMSALAELLPDLIILDILLDGPDGFTFLNELMSYSDTAKIPVIVASSLDLSDENLADYGVVGVLNKDTMTPAEVSTFVSQALISQPENLNSQGFETENVEASHAE